jgi:hypothetical protein
MHFAIEKGPDERITTHDLINLPEAVPTPNTFPFSASISTTDSSIMSIFSVFDMTRQASSSIISYLTDNEGTKPLDLWSGLAFEIEFLYDLLYQP